MVKFLRQWRLFDDKDNLEFVRNNDRRYSSEILYIVKDVNIDVLEACQKKIKDRNYLKWVLSSTAPLCRSSNKVTIILHMTLVGSFPFGTLYVSC